MTNSQQSTSDKFEAWETIKTFYKEKFGITPDIVNIIPDYNILKMCAAGASNSSISDFLEIPKEDEVYTPISNTIERYFGFRGWKTDLGWSPIALYESINDCKFEDYQDALLKKAGYYSEMPMELSFRVAEHFYYLERLLNEKWI